MFTSLKDKLLNASKIVLSSSTNEEELLDATVKLETGATILNYFQQKWAQLHKLNEENADNAALLAESIDCMYTKINSDYNNLIEISQILNATPTLNKSIDVCLNQIKNLQQSFESTEKKLMDLENIIENLELEKRKAEHKQQLVLYEEKKIVTLEAINSDLEAKHSQFVSEQELKEKKTLEERQQVFQDAFNNDLETFKCLGSIPKIETNVQSGALLEEIQLDLDQDDLETFLNAN